MWSAGKNNTRGLKGPSLLQAIKFESILGHGVSVSVRVRPVGKISRYAKYS